MCPVCIQLVGTHILQKTGHVKAVCPTVGIPVSTSAKASPASEPINQPCTMAGTLSGGIATALPGNIHKHEMLVRPGRVPLSHDLGHKANHKICGHDLHNPENHSCLNLQKYHIIGTGSLHRISDELVCRTLLSQILSGGHTIVINCRAPVVSPTYPRS